MDTVIQKKGRNIAYGLEVQIDIIYIPRFQTALCKFRFTKIQLINTSLCKYRKSEIIIRLYQCIAKIGGFSRISPA